MCGIAGIVGRRNAAQIVREGLQLLEYRGYDSSGVAWLEGGSIGVQRAVGSVEHLHVADGPSTVALGHTRWATHGGVTERNAHPHLDCAGKVAIVHNGVISNHGALRDELKAKGHTFRSETDSEVLAHLWEDAPGDGLERLRTLRGRLQGTYSLGVLDVDGGLYLAKQRNPLWVATVDGVGYLASDPVALRLHATSAVPLEDGDYGVLSTAGLLLHDHAGRTVTRKVLDIRAIDDRTSKAGYEHYMLKEMHETPAALNRLLAQHLQQGPPYVDLGIPEALLDQYRRVLFLGAGTSHHAALLAALFMQRVAAAGGEAKATPEYKDDPSVPPDGTLLVALSQSGETLDTMQALHRLRSLPAPLIAFTNHPSSSLGRQADAAVALRSGTEISVAATKTFLSQVLLAYLLALDKGRRSHSLGDGALASRARGLVLLPRAVERTLLRKTRIAELARLLLAHDNAFLLAKGYLLPVAMEGALKLKEIAYQHAEAYPAGELKHGPFALLTPETAVLFLHGPGNTQDTLLNSIHEVEARGAPVYVLAMEGCRADGLRPDRTVWLPATSEELAPIVFSVAIHMLSYWTAKGRGLPIDRPRNLAKSVTVE